MVDVGGVGRASSRPRLLGSVHGRPARDVIAEFAPHLDVAAEDARIERMDIEGPPAKLLPGARELLMGSSVVGSSFAVVTSCPPELGRVRIETAGLPIPRVFVTSDRVRAGKPDPEGYRLAARELGVDPAACVVFEDAPAGRGRGRRGGRDASSGSRRRTPPTSCSRRAPRPPRPTSPTRSRWWPRHAS